MPEHSYRPNPLTLRTLSAKVRNVGSWNSIRAVSLWSAMQLRNRLRRPYSITTAIFLCGTPRSGTTWVAELLTKGTGYHALIEPLRINAVRRAADVGFDWRTLIIPGTSWPAAEEFFLDLFTGRCMEPTMLAWMPFRALFDCQGWVVKSVRANRMLPWLVEKFAIRGYVLLIRHPCAVVASQLRDPRFNVPDLSMPEYRRFFDVYPEFEQIASRCREPEEIYALRWCMDQHVPFTSDKQGSWLVVRYEDLVLDGEKQLQRLFAYLRLSVPEAAFENLRSPSREAAKWSAIRTGTNPTLAWKSFLDPTKVGRIRRVVEAFGLDTLYTFD